MSQQLYQSNADLGLSLRKSSSIESEKIGVLPAGSLLEFILNSNKNYKVIDGENIIDGFWVKVRVNKSENLELVDKVGYVFSGYLKKENNIETTFKLNLEEEQVCTFTGEPIKNEILYGFISSKEANQVVNTILKRVGLKKNFTVIVGNVPNAAATIRTNLYGKNERYIIYSESFIQNLIDESKSYYAAIGVMAHEIAHHLNGHTLGSVSRPKIELEADEFAGSVIQKMGGTIKDAQSMFNNRIMYQPYDSKTHPATSARLEAVAVGWKTSNELYPNIDSKSTTITTKIETIRESQPKPSNAKPIFIRNECSEQIIMAIRYLAEDGIWVTDGWWIFEANESAMLSYEGAHLKTDNGIVYFYAKGESHFWEGDYPRMLNGQELPMKKFTLGVDEDGDYFIRLNCPKN